MTLIGTRFVAVVDIGKTNAKLALVDLETRSEVAALRQPNRPGTGGLYPEHDTGALWNFILEGLGELAGKHRIDAISVTTHGATAALVGHDDALALPVLDYEFPIPELVREHYDVVRPDFAESGTPPLPLGLNLGAQLYFLQEKFPASFARVAAILTWPQYWSWRLSGVMAGEATSLGCHTDLWNPHARDFSTLVDIMDWRRLFPPVRPANAVLGPVRPGIAGYAGLDPRTFVVNGIHDSNASLLPHLIDRKPPFAVVSTGTWVVSMAVGGRQAALDPARDTLVNVDAFGSPVPSARFMGGREFETVMAGRPQDWTEADLAAVLERRTMLLPAVQPGSGPFPRRAGGWTGTEEPEGGARFVAASFYLALMTATCLDLIGAEGPVVVEGPFAANRPYLWMLAAAAGRPVCAQDASATGTGIGAALLAGGAPAEPAPPIPPAAEDARLRDYAASWRRLAAS